MLGFEPNCVVLAILFDLKIPVNHHGFEYLKTAILMQYENPTLLTINEIYQAIAETYGNISEEIVATSIRRVIRIAWEQGDTALWDTYLPTLTTNKKRPPTNAEVIAGLARILELWQGCSMAYLRQYYQEVVSSGSK
jgi:hypothetical protein